MFLFGRNSFTIEWLTVAAIVGNVRKSQLDISMIES